jgi:hypothetical protein
MEKLDEDGAQKRSDLDGELYYIFYSRWSWLRQSVEASTCGDSTTCQAKDRSVAIDGARVGGMRRVDVTRQLRGGWRSSGDAGKSLLSIDKS